MAARPARPQHAHERGARPRRRSAILSRLLMSELLDRRPYDERDEPRFVREMAELTRHHLGGCPEYRRMWPAWRDARTAEELPFVHVAVFKRLLLRTGGAASGRLLRS